MVSLCHHLRNLNVAGRSDSEFSNFVSRQPITEAFARGVLDFVMKSSRNIHLVKKHIEDNEIESAFQWMFTKVEHDRIPFRYYPPTEKNDPVFGGVGEFAKAALQGLAMFLTMQPKAMDARVYLDNEAGIEEYLRMIYTDHGMSQSNKKSKLSIYEAEQLGRTYVGDQQQWLPEFTSSLIEKNPNFVRFALDSNGQKIGATCVFPISAEAYQETVCGKRRMEDYKSEEIPTIGNHLVLFTYCENQSAGTPDFLFSRRRKLLGSFLSHIALLLNPEEGRDIRAITYKIQASNSSRIEKYQFHDVAHFKSDTQPDYTVVAFDQSNESSLLNQMAMKSMISHLWLLRESLDKARR
jgi:hypothetical protein